MTEKPQSVLYPLTVLFVCCVMVLFCCWWFNNIRGIFFGGGALVLGVLYARSIFIVYKKIRFITVPVIMAMVVLVVWLLPWSIF
jgi:hypothetical protein